MPQPSFPTDCESLTADWLTAALGGQENLGARITGFSADRVGEGVGFMGVVSRLSLAYDREAPAAPRSVIAKFPSPDPGARGVAATFRHYEKEARFYEQLAAHSPVHAPRAYYQAFDPQSGDFALLLEDLAPRRNGDQLKGLSRAEAALAIETLGRLQACWWETPELDAVPWLPAFSDPSMLVLEAVFQQCWGPYQAFLGDKLPPPMRAVGDRLATRIQKILHRLSESPCTLVHGDFRADNFFFGDDGASLAVVDWQIVLKGRGAFDLAYLLTGNLSVEDRRDGEAELVRLYAETLRANGVAGYGFDEAWRDYRLCAVFGWIWPVVAIGSLDPSNARGLAFFFEWSRRVCTAIEDLEAARLLEAF
ncbi:phosphotransferase [Phenylobacterium sp.]|jgi:aminoglycoside/choline kinase family phosphotransferase|uniref:phosphotransferase n=1 Tax=Phenylobacterium sp. TaxID=1871053 RepID=UPI002619C307|nr:phosphotransferase [Phenylobacterium sp.]